MDEFLLSHSSPSRTDFMMLLSVIVAKEAHDMKMISDLDYNKFLANQIDTIGKYCDLIGGKNGIPSA